MRVGSEADESRRLEKLGNYIFAQYFDIGCFPKARSVDGKTPSGLVVMDPTRAFDRPSAWPLPRPPLAGRRAKADGYPGVPGSSPTAARIDNVIDALMRQRQLKTVRPSGASWTVMAGTPSRFSRRLCAVVRRSRWDTVDEVDRGNPGGDGTGAAKLGDSASARRPLRTGQRIDRPRALDQCPARRDSNPRWSKQKTKSNAPMTMRVHQELRLPSKAISVWTMPRINTPNSVPTT